MTPEESKFIRFYFRIGKFKIMNWHIYWLMRSHSVKKPSNTWGTWKKII